MMGIGIRAHKNVHAFDASANFLNPAIFHLRGLYLLYPAQKGAYLGTGLGFLNEPESMKHSSGSFEAVLGWEWKISRDGRIFFELDGIVPFGEIDVKNMSRFWPGLTIGLGF